MTQITVQDGKIVLRGGKVGTGAGCCCEDELGCCETYGAAICNEELLPDDQGECPAGFTYDFFSGLCLKSTIYVPGQGFECPSTEGADWSTSGNGDCCADTLTTKQACEESQVTGPLGTTVNIYKAWYPAGSGRTCTQFDASENDPECRPDGFWSRSTFSDFFGFSVGKPGCVKCACVNPLP